MFPTSLFQSLYPGCHVGTVRTILLRYCYTDRVSFITYVNLRGKLVWTGFGIGPLLIPFPSSFCHLWKSGPVSQDYPRKKKPGCPEVTTVGDDEGVGSPHTKNSDREYLRGRVVWIPGRRREGESGTFGVESGVEVRTLENTIRQDSKT